MTMTIPVGGKQHTEQAIYDGSTVYVNIGGLSSGLAPGKQWVSVPTGQIDRLQQCAQHVRIRPPCCSSSSRSAGR